MSSFARARFNCPQHTGAASLIRSALGLGESLSVYKLTLATGLKAEQVKRALNGMLESGGIVSTKGRDGHMYYALYKPEKQDKGSGQIAGRITIGRGSFWGAGLV